jgi:hypothetical protein
MDPSTWPRRLRLIAAATGILGTAILIGSFVINPAPPAGGSIADVVTFGAEHRTTILLGAWMQGIGSLLTVLFCIMLVSLAGAMHRICGWIALLSGAAILGVSLLEVSVYIVPFQQVSPSDERVVLTTSLALIEGVQHAFLIAPALLLPVGYAVLTSRLLPRAFGYTGLILGGSLQVLGLLGLFNLLQPLIDVLLPVQGLWFIAAAVALLLPWRTARIKS